MARDLRIGVRSFLAGVISPTPGLPRFHRKNGIRGSSPAYGVSTTAALAGCHFRSLTFREAAVRLRALAASTAATWRITSE